MRRLVSSLVTAALLLAAAAPTLAPTQARAQGVAELDQQVGAECRARSVERDSEEVLPRVRLTWDSSLACRVEVSRGTFSLEISMRSDAAGAQSVTITAVELSHATPRPGGRSPQASFRVVGLPLRLAAGESGSLLLSGRHQLLATDEGWKANLHFRARGQSQPSGEPFNLAINLHIRGSGSELEEPGARAGDEGRPSGVPGPPAWLRGGR